MTEAFQPGSRWLLAFDASTPVPTIALGRVDAERDELVASDAIETGANQASVTLIPRIEGVLGRAGIEMGDLDVIGCGRGPGTFTGSRVATAAAKGLALGLGVPVLPISTLAAVAAGHEGDGVCLAVLDARRGEVYAARYALDGRRVQLEDAEQCARLADVIAALPSAIRPRLHLVGPGVAAYADQIPDDLRARAVAGAGLRAPGLWRAAVAALREGAAVSPAALEVTYLRASYAEMGINAPKRPPKRSPWV